MITLTTYNAYNEQLTTEQRFVLPGIYNWKQFKAFQSLMAEKPIRISYVDGVIELIKIGEQNELIKSMIGILLGVYFVQKGIEFIPVGSATRESEEEGASFEPDESYYIGEQKDNPDLGIEVNITSGSVKKLEKYKRFQFQEVWFWQDNRFSIYGLENGESCQIFRSQLLPEMNLNY